MKNKKPRSLIARLTLVQIAILAVLWLMVIGFSVLSIYRQGKGEVDVDVRTIATVMAQLTPDSASATEAKNVAAMISAIALEHSEPLMRAGELAYQIWSRDGRLLARSVDLPVLPDMPPHVFPLHSDVVAGDWHVQEAWSSSRGIHAVVASRGIFYHRAAWSAVGQLAGVWLLLAAASAIAFWLSFRIIIRPVRVLAIGLASRSTDDLSPVDDAGAFVEVQPLLDALNQKLARIRAMLESERQFFADAAHELRTPLSVIGAQAHVLAHEPELSQRVVALRQIEGGIERGARVISRLLLLGKLEGAATQMTLARNDVATIAAAIVDSLQARAAMQGQTLRLLTDVAVECDCDAEAVAVVLENLVDNALRYSPVGATVEVSVESRAGATLIRVADDGPGIAVADRERVFARFERLGAADQTGSGLGLAIVQRIAVLHGGSARVVDGPAGYGAILEVRI
jgi:two-component system, OmpR family, sensor histidine kinase QseC